MYIHKKCTNEACREKDLHYMQNAVDEGTLRVRVSAQGNGMPVENAKVTVSYTGGPQEVVEELTTDNSGNAQELILRTPPLEYSMQPNERQPYAEYTISKNARNLAFKFFSSERI